MKINFNNWEHKDFNSKKLPSEEDLEDFFSCINSESRNSEEGFFGTVPKFDYSNANSSGYRSRQNYPLFCGNSGTTSLWITPSLKNLSPEVELSSTFKALTRSADYNDVVDVSNRSIGALGLSLDREITRRIEAASEANCVSSTYTVKNFKDLHHIKYKIETFIREFITHECNVFKKGLKEQGYVQTSTHSEILEKISLIREATSLDPIYIIAETPLLDYLKVHSVVPGELTRNAWLIMDNYNSYSYRENNIFDNYKSAVFTTQNMAASHSFETHYRLERGNRQWRIYFAAIGKLGMDIPLDPLSSEDGKLILDDNPSRWNRLF